jgi:hypothetical protein
MTIKEKQFHFPNAALLFQTLCALGLICTVCKSSYRLKYSTPSTHAVTNKTTGVLCNIFPLPALCEYSTLAQSSKLTLYQLLIRSTLTYRSFCLEFHSDSDFLKLPQTPCRPKQQLAFSRLMIYIYMSYRTANLQTLHFIYLFNKYTYWIF